MEQLFLTLYQNISMWYNLNQIIRLLSIEFAFFPDIVIDHPESYSENLIRKCNLMQSEESQFYWMHKCPYGCL